MYICYLDESGTVDPSASTEHFVLLGLAIPAATWKEKDADVSRVKNKYGLADAEIHAAWMAREYPEQKTIPGFESMDWAARRRAVLGVRGLNLSRPRSKNAQAELLKNYRKTQAYVHLARGERASCLREMADVIGGWQDARAFADSQWKQHIPAGNRFDMAFQQVISRFDLFLRNAGNAFGLLVQDNNQTVARKLTDAMRRYHRAGTTWTNITQIVETPLFVDSELTGMVQLADLGAYATRRYFEKGERDLFDRIGPVFDRNRGRLVGLRHYTAKHECRCDVCVDHGRYA